MMAAAVTPHPLYYDKMAAPYFSSTLPTDYLRAVGGTTNPAGTANPSDMMSTTPYALFQHQATAANHVQNAAMTHSLIGANDNLQSPATASMNLNLQITNNINTAKEDKTSSDTNSKFPSFNLSAQQVLRA